ncbi:MAG: hypothetical protein ACI841_004170 [Planctomycetota bacterium]|jgi:hypothetical protein
MRLFSLTSLWSVLLPVLVVAQLHAQSADPALGKSGASQPKGTSSQFLGTGNSALVFQSGSGSCAANNGQTVGWMFDVVTEVTVTGMSWIDDFHNGVEIAHEVGIWDPSGALIPNTNVVVPTGTIVPLIGDWRVVTIPPTVLTPGTGYIVGGYNGNHSECLSFNVTQTVHPSLNIVDAQFSPFGNALEIPLSSSKASNGFYGVGFEVGVGGGAIAYCNPSGANSVSPSGALLESTGAFGTPGATFRLTSIPNQPGAMLISTAQQDLPFGCGRSCVGGTVIRGPVLYPTGGVIDTPMAMGPTFTYAQYWYRDPANLVVCGNAFTLSNGLMP